MSCTKVHCSLSDVDKAVIQENLEFKYLFVINNTEAWRSVPTVDERSSYSNSISFYSNEGPNWETGIEVDVVLELISNGKPYFIISNNNEITKVE